MKQAWHVLLKHWGKAITVLALASTLAAVWWLLPPQPRLAWQTPEPCSILAVSADGRVLATGFEPIGHVKPEAIVRLWDMKTGQQTAALGENVVGFDVVRGSLSPDGRFLVVHEVLDGHLRVIDTVSREKVGELCFQAEPDGFVPFPEFCFSPDSGSFAYTWQSYKKELTAVSVWDMTKGVQRYRLEGEHAPVFSPDGRVLATVFQTMPIAQEPIPQFWSPDSVGVTLWDAASGEELHRFPLPKGWRFESVLFSADSHTVVTICHALYPATGRMVQWRDVASGTLLTSREGKWTMENAAPGTPLQHRMLLADEQEPGFLTYMALDTGEVRKMAREQAHSEQNDSSGEQIQLLIDRLGPSRTPESSTDGRFYARWESQRSRLSQWWERIGEWLPFLQTDQGSMAVQLWDIRTGRKLATLPGEHDFAFSPTGDVLAVRRGSNTIQIWDLPPRKPVAWFLVIAAVILTLPAAIWWRARRQSLS